MPKIQAQDFPRSRINWNQSQERSDHCRLARPVGSQKPNRSRGHADRKIVKRLNGSISLRDIRKLKQHSVLAHSPVYTRSTLYPETMVTVPLGTWKWRRNITRLTRIVPPKKP